MLAARRHEAYVAALSLPAHGTGANVRPDALPVDAAAFAADVAHWRLAQLLVAHIRPPVAANHRAVAVTRVATLIVLKEKKRVSSFSVKIQIRLSA